MCNPMFAGVAGLGGGILQGIGGFMQREQAAASNTLNAAGVERAKKADATFGFRFLLHQERTDPLLEIRDDEASD